MNPRAWIGVVGLALLVVAMFVGAVQVNQNASRLDTGVEQLGRVETEACQSRNELRRLVEGIRSAQEARTRAFDQDVPVPKFDLDSTRLLDCNDDGAVDDADFDPTNPSP